ncbi:phospholipase [Mycobacterium kubicae]|uniref:alpha/beta hydrolase n=1 Tax=Mycobacterium kubicae TaxID=120959 RepID=UPI0016420358|nr:phospholipase [Mycobacterium kubicae]QNI07240.1 phospholipase [Mycobacterium kubicae]
MTAFGSGDGPHLEEDTPATAPADPSGGRLGARVRAPTLPPYPAGLHALALDRGRNTLLYVPSGYRGDAATPLAVLMHGAGGNARGGIDPFLAVADAAGVLLLAPQSAASTWDVIVGSFGPDVRLLDDALAHVFARHSVDANHLAIGGFSDGASYALSLGLTNGNLFSHVIAFSPGFAAPGATCGRPNIYITHGTNDQVLPIDMTSRRLRPRLERAGYDVVYHEFCGGHVVPTDRAKSGLNWFLH